MNKTSSIRLLLFGIVYLISTPLLSQNIYSQPDPVIKQMVDEISAQNLESIIRKLASFETRHSLSSTTNKLWQITKLYIVFHPHILVLLLEVLIHFAHTYSRKAGLAERSVVAATQETVIAVN